MFAQRDNSLPSTVSFHLVVLIKLNKMHFVDAPINFRNGFIGCIHGYFADSKY